MRFFCIVLPHVTVNSEFFVSLYYGCMFCMLVFNFVNICSYCYVIYSYCYVFLLLCYVFLLLA
jgi:hypothetical protein